MRSESEIRERLVLFLQRNRDALVAKRTEKYPQWNNHSIDNLGGMISGLCWALGYEGTIDFLESEVRAGRASLGADLDAKIRAKGD